MERWITVLAYSTMHIVLDIRGTKYEYSAAERDIRKFRKLLKYNQGKALSFLKQRAFVLLKFSHPASAEQAVTNLKGCPQPQEKARTGSPSP